MPVHISPLATPMMNSGNVKLYPNMARKGKRDSLITAVALIIISLCIVCFRYAKKKITTPVGKEQPSTVELTEENGRLKSQLVDQQGKIERLTQQLASVTQQRNYAQHEAKVAQTHAKSQLESHGQWVLDVNEKETKAEEMMEKATNLKSSLDATIQAECHNAKGEAAKAEERASKAEERASKAEKKLLQKTRELVRVYRGLDKAEDLVIKASAKISRRNQSITQLREMNFQMQKEWDEEQLGLLDQIHRLRQKVALLEQGKRD
ncbi:MAG: hypothetical protein SP4CHLAM5_04990 [Chlamydiia bacterium]|nr:hypothetical protein [Chlamydiia bacterium]